MNARHPSTKPKQTPLHDSLVFSLKENSRTDGGGGGDKADSKPGGRWIHKNRDPRRLGERAAGMG